MRSRAIKNTILTIKIGETYKGVPKMPRKRLVSRLLVKQFRSERRKEALEALSKKG